MPCTITTTTTESSTSVFRLAQIDSSWTNRFVWGLTVHRQRGLRSLRKGQLKNIPIQWNRQNLSLLREVFEVTSTRVLHFENQAKQVNQREGHR